MTSQLTEYLAQLLQKAKNGHKFTENDQLTVMTLINALNDDDVGDAAAIIAEMIAQVNTFTAVQTFNVPNIYSLAGGITANSGGIQAGATPITKEYSLITTCASNGHSVLLPVVAIGTVLRIRNNTLNYANIFPQVGSVIYSSGTEIANDACILSSDEEIIFTATAANTWKTSRIGKGKGTVSLPSMSFNAQSNMGLYWISSTQLGVSIGGQLKAFFNANGLATTSIEEQIATVGVTVDGLVIRDSRIEINSTGYFGVTKAADTTLTIDETGIIFGNKATALTLTLPPTVAGFSYKVVNINGGGVINLSPDAIDYIGGSGLTKVDNKDLIIPAVVGAYAQIVADGVNGWYIADASGILTKEV